MFYKQLKDRTKINFLFKKSKYIPTLFTKCFKKIALRITFLLIKQTREDKKASVKALSKCLAKGFIKGFNSLLY